MSETPATDTRARWSWVRVPPPADAYSSSVPREYAFACGGDRRFKIPLLYQQPELHKRIHYVSVNNVMLDSNSEDRPLSLEV